MPNLIGQSLGRYHILEQLGEGGMATVYTAYDTRLERDVAVKIIRRGVFPPEQIERILKRFEREAKALARLTHPNIVPIIDYGEYKRTPYLVMPYLPGGTLKQKLGKPMPWQEAVRILLPIAQALDYAHEQKIIHRDIKPSNILLTKKGQPMLSDFGIAKILDLDDGQTLSTPGVGIGTPEYMSPEQGMGKPVSASTDIYSLGIVLYELLTGRKPFTANTPMAVVVKHLNDPLPRPRQYVPNLPEEVEKILLKALAKKPEDRYTDMAAFVVALENLTSRPISQPDAPRPRVGDSMAANDQVATRDEIDPAPAKRIAISTSQRNPPKVLQDKKRAWWPWAIGLGGLTLLASLVIAVVVLGGNLLEIFSPPTRTLTLTTTPTLTFTLMVTITPVFTSMTRTLTTPTAVLTARATTTPTTVTQVWPTSISPTPVPPTPEPPTDTQVWPTSISPTPVSPTPVPPTVPNAPSGMTFVLDNYCCGATFSWQDNSDDEDGFVFSVQNTCVGCSGSDTLPPNTTSRHFFFFPSDHPWTFSVSAYNNLGTSRTTSVEIYWPNIQPTDTPEPPTNTPEPPTDTPEPPTDTPEPPTDTPEPV